MAPISASAICIYLLEYIDIYTGVVVVAAFAVSASGSDLVFTFERAKRWKVSEARYARAFKYATSRASTCRTQRQQSQRASATKRQWNTSVAVAVAVAAAAAVTVAVASAAQLLISCRSSLTDCSKCCLVMRGALSNNRLEQDIAYNVLR